MRAAHATADGKKNGIDIVRSEKKIFLFKEQF